MAKKTTKKPKVTAKKTTAVKPKVEKQVKPTAKKSNYIDEAKYTKFTDLYFVEMSGVKLKDEQIKQMGELKAEIEKADGLKSIREKRATIKNEQFLFVEGLPVPEKTYKAVKSEGSGKYYFGE